MLYLYIESDDQTSFSPPMSHWAEGSYEFPDEFVPEYYKEGKRASGFVRVTHDETRVLSCAWDEEAYQKWEAENPEPPRPATNPIPSPEQSAVVMMRTAFSAQLPDMEDDAIIQCSGLADDWASGNHNKGDIYNTRQTEKLGPEWEQTWECFQGYDNSTYPDIVPGNSAWYTFNRPLHGKSPDTARPWVKPQHGTTDIYHVGECMVFTDGKIYMCKRDTDFSPTEYAPDWEEVKA